MKLVMTIGVPGCGKSTYIRPLAETQGLALISPDDIRQELLGDTANHTNEPLVWRTVFERTQHALATQGAAIDATNTRRNDRKKFIRLAHDLGAQEIVGYWFTTPLLTCKQRNAQRDRKVPEQVIEAMHKRLTQTPPTLDEGFTKIVKIT